MIDSGISIVVRLLQLWKEKDSMVLTELGILIEVREEQLEKALRPREVTELGIVTEVILLHQLKSRREVTAYFSPLLLSVTDDGMVILPDISEEEGVTDTSWFSSEVTVNVKSPSVKVSPSAARTAVESSRAKPRSKNFFIALIGLVCGLRNPLVGHKCGKQKSVRSVPCCPLHSLRPSHCPD